MQCEFKGVISALPTPYDQSQQIDMESLRKLIRFNIEQNIKGLYVGGSTGEAFLQNVAEREKILETVADESDGRLTLIAHVGGISTAESEVLAKAAKKYGYHAISAVTPFYYPFSFEEHCIHYRKIIDSADGLPMVVYNIPALSGVRFSLDQINELVTIPRVCALKQTSGDLFQMEQIKRNHPELVLYNGYDEIFASGLIAGADGGIGSTYNIMGWCYLEIFEAVKNNDVIKAKEMQVACNQVIDTLIQSGVLAGIKTLLYYMGIINTPVCRSPFSPVKEKNLDVLSKLAERLFEEHDRNKKMKII
ncbi:TPA: N-acetylneuraminate lyase [Escherichia coli]|nr:N-acetylneuraminate lyase [Escherichia coli]